MKISFRDLWRHSALPVLVIIVGLFLVGVWLQRRAVQLRSQPLVIEVTQAPASRVGTETTFEPAIEEQEPAGDSTGDAGPASPRGLFRSALEAQRMGRSEQAVEGYRQALRLRPTYWEAAYNLGVLYLSSGNPGEAMSVLAGAAGLAGGDRKARTLYNLGVAYGRVGMLLNAEKSFQDAINLSPAHLKARVSLAEVYRKLSRSRDAERMYREALRLDDGYAPAWFGLALLEMESGNKERAEERLQKAVSLNPAYEEARHQLAALLFEKGDLGRARAQLEYIVENSDSPAEALFHLGRMEFARRQYSKAADLYRRAYDQSGGSNLAALNNLALSFKALGQTEQARDVFLEALAKQPEYASAHYNLGLLYLEEGEPAAAQAAFEHAVALDPRSADSWYNLGVVYARRNTPRRAVEAYERALALEPANQKARLNLAVQYSRVGEHTKAVEQYRLVVAAQPSYAAAWYNIALALKELDQSTEAEQAYLTAIRLAPNETKYRLNLGTLYAGLDRTADAIRVYREALEIDPRDAGLHYNLALQYKKTGEPAQARAELERAVSLDPSYAKGWLAIAGLAAESGDHAGAVQALLKVLELDPEDALTRYELGKEYLTLSDFTRAAGLFEKSLTRVQDNPWIWYNLGKARQQLGREAEAQKAYNQALALDPGMSRLVSRRLGEGEDSLQSLKELVAKQPDNTRLRLQLADQLRRQGAAREAVQEIDRVLMSAPKEAAAWAALAEIQIDQDELARAEDTLRKARGLLPQDGQIAYLYAKVLIKRENLEQALPALELAAARLAKPVAALRLLGTTRYELKDYPGAIAALRRAWELDPDDGNTAIDLGKAHYRAKDNERAAALFREARHLMPDYSWGGIWLGRALVAMKDSAQAQRVYTEVMERDPGFIQSYISLGDLADRNGDPAAARDYYRQALQIDPFHQATKDKLAKLQQ